jgi:hypothetical protein
MRLWTSPSGNAWTRYGGSCLPANRKTIIHHVKIYFDVTPVLRRGARSRTSGQVTTTVTAATREARSHQVGTQVFDITDASSAAGPATLADN